MINIKTNLNNIVFKREDTKIQNKKYNILFSYNIIEYYFKYKIVLVVKYKILFFFR